MLFDINDIGHIRQVHVTFESAERPTILNKIFEGLDRLGDIADLAAGICTLDMLLVAQETTKGFVMLFLIDTFNPVIKRAGGGVADEQRKRSLDALTTARFENRQRIVIENFPQAFRNKRPFIFAYHDCILMVARSVR